MARALALVERLLTLRKLQRCIVNQALEHSLSPVLCYVE